MSVLTRSSPVTPVSPAIVLALVEKARERHWAPEYGALGVRGVLAGEELALREADGTSVRVVFAGSVLAARELLCQRRPDSWLVLVTDREESDLGAGVLAQLIGAELRSPDPWQAVRQRFRAATIDAQLTSASGHREIAHGFLEAMPLDAWAPAPAGALTRDHAFGCLAHAVLDLPRGAVDLITVLGWSTRPGLTQRWAALRDRGGNALADAAARWLASACGPAAPAVEVLLARGRLDDLAPLGVVVDLLTAPTVPAADSRVALAHLAHRWGGPRAEGAERGLTTVAAQAPVVLTTLLADERTRPDAERALAAADLLARQGGAEGLAAKSALLPTGLKSRFATLADLLRRPPAEELAAVEQAHTALHQHALLTVDDRRRPGVEGAVRLVRWLATFPDDVPVGGDRLGALAARQVATDGWVDAAVNDVASGVDDRDLGDGLAHVLELTQAVRDAHDLEFAAALREATADEAGAAAGYLEAPGTRIWLLERLLPDLVLPRVLAGGEREPTLLLVLDGLSTGVASELVQDILSRDDWQELLPDGVDRRSGALAALPTITEVSRASLLCGALTTGQQDVERRGYEALTRAHGVPAVLFHKRALDSTRAGHALADEVRAALDDTAGRPLVTCVLNTIDDALDRSDPGGTVWDADHVKHLRPLLDRARETGRSVVITSDHGHVVERRAGEQRAQPDGERKTRYRSAPQSFDTAEVADDEVLVRGPRVLAHGGRAVLAVNERLRYGPLKAGYHGGATPAEAVVPVVLLVPTERAQAPGLRLAPPQQPTWWSPPLGPAQSAPVPAPMTRRSPVGPTALPTLFDEAPEPASVPTSTSLGALLTASATYAEQREVAGRLALADGQVARVVDALVATGHRLRPEQLAHLLQLPVVRVRGAVEQLVRVLNVDGYPVLARDPATSAVVLDESLAREQFGLPR